MKKIFLPFVAAITLTACSKDDQLPGNYQTPLPEATQTGKGTFACYVDGDAYIAKKKQITAYYQYVAGQYSFIVSGSKESKPIFSISIGSTNDGLTEGAIYDLRERIDGNQWGGILFDYYPDIVQINTTDNTTYKGKMTITKLDMENQIIAGTFWFDVRDPKTGETRKVRDGRFDVVANF